MRLTKQTNYAIRALMYCASNQGRLSRVHDIAVAYTVSETFLFKVVQSLVAAGLLDSVRGRAGGIRLARPARDIGLVEVVRVTESSFALAECFEEEGADCPLIENCVLNTALREALAAFFDVLSRYTIADLVAPHAQLTRLLNIPSEPDQAILPTKP